MEDLKFLHQIFENRSKSDNSSFSKENSIEENNLLEKFSKEMNQNQIQNQEELNKQMNITLVSKDNWELNFKIKEETPFNIDLKNVLKKLECEIIKLALLKGQKNKNRAAKILKLNRTTLIEKIKKLSIASE